MTKLSKLVGNAGMITCSYNCYEMAHTWDPNCLRAALILYKDALPFSFRTYAPLYVVRYIYFFISPTCTVTFS